MNSNATDVAGFNDTSVWEAVGAGVSELDGEGVGVAGAKIVGVISVARAGVFGKAASVRLARAVARGTRVPFTFFWRTTVLDLGTLPFNTEQPCSVSKLMPSNATTKRSLTFKNLIFRGWRQFLV